MTTEITTLDPDETRDVLVGHRLGKTQSMLSQLAVHLTEIVDTDSSIFATGLNDSAINGLRTRMYRRDINLTVRKVNRGGERGHIIMARTVRPEEQS